MPWTTGVSKHVLPNGLTLLVQRDASAPVVAVVSHVRAGYFDEPDEWVGIAHVLEHMYFKGTARRQPGDVARETQLAGGYINAATIYDKTIYYTVLPSAGGGLAKALDVQADALMHAALDTGELERELEVIVQEANRKLDSPPAVTVETLYGVLFRVHRMRRWRIGTEAGLRRLSATDVRRYYESRYTPDRVIVGIAGDVEIADALRLAGDAYGAWNRPTAEVPGSPQEPNERRATLRILHGDIERPLGAIGWRTVGTLHDDAPALNVTAAILGAGRGSRLYREVRQPGLAGAARAVHFTPTEVGVFEVGIEGGGDGIDAAIARSLDLVAGLAEAGPVEDELERVRALVATDWAHRFESADGRAAALCEAEALGGYRLADALYERTLAVTAAAVRRVARRYLDSAAASAVMYLPEGTASALEDGTWPPPRRAVRSAFGSTALAAAPSRRAQSGASAEAEHPGGIWRRSVPGVDLLARAKPGSGLVSLGFVFPGVPGRETSRTAGISALLARATLRGAGGMSADQLALAAEALGGGIAPHVGTETTGWWITVRADAAAQAAELLRRVAFEPTLADPDVDVERGLQASDARRARDDMFRHPIQRALAHAFAGDPYGLSVLGEPETVLNLGAGDVRAWAASLARHRAVAVAVGDLDAASLLRALAPLADRPLAHGADGAAARPAPWCETHGSETRRKAQSALAMAFPAVPYASPDRYALVVLGSLLSGLAGRLFDELREKRSLAYTVAAVPWLARRGGAFLTYIATAPEREAEARDAMLAELERVRQEPVPAAELERARNFAAGCFEVRQQRGRSVAAEIVEAWVHDVIDELADTPLRLRRVTSEDLLRVADRVLRAEWRAEYVVRGVARSAGTRQGSEPSGDDEGGAR